MKGFRFSGVWLVLAAVGCTGSGDAEMGVDAPARTDPEMLERRQQAADRTVVERTATAPSTPVTGEVPADILDALRADLAQRTDGAEARVLRDEAVVWPSGALGCPEPGRMYTQAQVPGYHVVFDVGGSHHDYRVNNGGAFRLCETVLMPKS